MSPGNGKEGTDWSSIEVDESIELDNEFEVGNEERKERFQR